MLRAPGGYSLFNVGAFGNTSDRALGSDPTLVAAVGPAGGISGTFTYVYVTNDGSGHYVASAPSNQLSLSNAKATITGVPAGADLYRQKGGLTTPSTPWQLVASNLPGGAYTDTTADPVPGSPAVLPGADTRTAIGAGATGAADFIPGANPPVLNSTVPANAAEKA